MGLAAFVAACLVLAVFFVFRLQVAGVSREVEAAQEKSKRLSDAKAQLQQFADRKQELQKRQKIAADVIDKRVEWSKLLNEISMITPSEVWLESILGDEGEDGLTFRGYTPDATATAESTASASKEATEGPVLDADGHKAGYDLELTRIISEAVSVPVIGSLNGVSNGGWIKYAKLIEEAGADALELNLYFVAADADVSGDDLENAYLEVIKNVRREIRIPLAVKLSPFFSSLPNFVQKVAQAGVRGVVLFNRFLQPDIDIEELVVRMAVGQG